MQSTNQDNKPYLLYARKCYISGRILATKLGLIGTSVVREYPPSVRYGNSECSGSVEEDTIYNSPDVIRLCSNSLAFSQWCLSNSIRSSVYEPLSMNFDDFPFLIRKKYHAGGKDIVEIKSKEDLETFVNNNGLSGYYHVPFIYTTSEVGVHYMLGRTIKIFKKQAISQDCHPFIRSAWKGYHYSVINNEHAYEVCREIVEKVGKLLGLQFGRFDVGYNNDNHTYTIFEVNTAPGLNPYTAEMYAAELRQCIKL